MSVFQKKTIQLHWLHHSISETVNLSNIYVFKLLGDVLGTAFLHWKQWNLLD